MNRWGNTVIDLQAQAMVDIMAIRWNIETFFEYDKDLLGSDHYQLMSVQAIPRFWTLTACLICFLEEQRALALGQQLTCGDIRRIIHEDHRLNLLRWLEDRFKNGYSVEQISIQLAL